tara:strand:- start:463 stop:885 length:423 start_codon:yes stop_codon:yes gene_type:complete
MTEPLVNTSIKSFKSLKGKPACASRYTPHFENWGSRQTAPNPTAQKKMLFKTIDDITSPQKQIGINPQYQISLPCCEVNEMPNKRINAGKGRGFNKSNVVAKPITGLDPIAFIKKDRVGKFGMEISQQPFTFSSWQSSGC